MMKVRLVWSDGIMNSFEVALNESMQGFVNRMQRLAKLAKAELIAIQILEVNHG